MNCILKKVLRVALYDVGAFLVFFGGLGLIAGIAGLTLGEFHGPVYTAFEVIWGSGIMCGGILSIRGANGMKSQ